MSLVSYESANNVSYITFYRPERYNALNQEMLEGLLQILVEIESNEDRVVVLTGAGKAFSAGGDIAMMKDFSNKAFFDDVMETIAEIAMKLYMLPKIVLSAIQGSAAGLGLSIGLNADYVIANKTANLGMLFIGIGLAPDGGGHFLLKERLGAHDAKHFIWEKEQVNGAVAKEMGLVDILTEKNAVEFAAEFAVKLYNAPLTSMIKTKMLYHSEQKETFRMYLQEEQETQWELKNTMDHAEGVTAFLEKRHPVFTGS